MGLMLLKLEAGGQKPAIDLLPSSQHHLHPEAIVDTGAVYDSSVHFTADSQSIYTHSGNRERKERMQENKRKERSFLKPLFKKRGNNRQRTMKKSGFHPLIINIANPLHIIFHITALN
jgi:hypothetical protein